MHKEHLKEYITEEFIPDSSPSSLPDDLNLLESGILDSMAVLRVVAHIEDHFDISLDPTEIDPENLCTVTDISNLISSKTASSDATAS